MQKSPLILLVIVLLLVAFGSTVWFFRKPAVEKLETSEDLILKEIKNRGEIIIGTEATYPPMEFIDEQGNFAGLDIDIAKEVAFQLGVGVKFKNVNWDKLISFEPLFEKEVDMLISAITITPERAEKVAFSDPYFNAGQVILTLLNKADEIVGTESLTGKKLGVQEGTTSALEALKYTNAELVINYPDYEEAERALLNEEIEAIIIDYPAGLGRVAKNKNLIIIGEPFTQEFYGIVVQKEASSLLEEINSTIRQLKREGKIEALTEKWFKE